MVDHEVIDRALAAVDDLWSQPSKLADTGVHHGYRQVTIYLAGRPQLAGFEWLDEMFAPIRGAWFSWIDPHGFIVDHIDAGPYFERWQIPCSANGRLHPGPAHRVGVPLKVRHFDWHSVTNESDRPRLALVIDRDIPLDIPTAPFQVRSQCPF